MTIKTEVVGKKDDKPSSTDNDGENVISENTSTENTSTEDTSTENTSTEDTSTEILSAEIVGMGIASTGIASSETQAVVPVAVAVKDDNFKASNPNSATVVGNDEELGGRTLVESIGSIPPLEEWVTPGNTTPTGKPSFLSLTQGRRMMSETTEAGKIVRFNYVKGIDPQMGKGYYHMSTKACYRICGNKARQVVKQHQLLCATMGIAVGCFLMVFLSPFFGVLCCCLGSGAARRVEPHLAEYLQVCDARLAATAPKGMVGNPTNMNMWYKPDGGWKLPPEIHTRLSV